MPDFLVIGAMKAGTTTFYHDLSGHPHVCLAEKELNALTRDVAKGEYGAHFQHAKSHQLCGDVSTTYSMLPDIPGVAERANRLLPQSTKILYLVREPVQRAISHHYHYFSLRDDRRVGADINECVTKYPSLANYGKYGTNLEHWLRHWGADAIQVIRFEDYVADRRQVMESVFRFLGLPRSDDHALYETVRNASVGKPVLNRFWRRMTEQRVYRRLVRPCLSPAMRDRLRMTLLPTAPPRPAPPRPDTVEQLLSVFMADGERLQQLANRSTPFWDFNAVRSHHSELYREWELSQLLYAA